MTDLQDLFTHNRAWAAQMERECPGFFTGLKTQQNPKYMWIGCSDSRVPAAAPPACRMPGANLKFFPKKAEFSL